ncbi:uncharacterized protein LOC105687643 [Athalia rosae]|uniref:uncharacterized protein LOC105687643 n=1 Tax=Athalia rosae TaxID=37344 RepID=UPI002033455D|nr:uncharacterized protein LOC105687643 [Athalia rosae]
MEQVLSISWSNRILLTSTISILICLILQVYVAQLSVSTPMVISWAILIITLSIWLSCVALRLILKANSPLIIQPFNKWLQLLVSVYIKHDLQLTQQQQSEIIKDAENTNIKPLSTTASNNDQKPNNEDSSSNGTFQKITNQNKDSSSTFMARINLDETVDEIDSKFINVWYQNVSNDETFCSEAKLLLKNLLDRVNHQLNNVDQIEVVRKIGNVLLLHLKEYRRSLRRLEKGTVTDIEEAYRYVHPGSRNTAALEYSLHRVITVLAREFLQWEIMSSLPCKLLFSVLAKKLLSRIETISSPNWIYGVILTAVSSEPIDTEKNTTHNKSAVSSALSDAILSTTAAVISRPFPKAGQAAIVSTNSKVNNENGPSLLERRASLSLDGLEISHRGLWANVEISEPDSEPDEDRLSPVYEEPTDLATTIARLRSLLHQKSNVTTPQQTEEKSCTVYEDSHLAIPWTEFHTAPDGSQQLFYCIQFDDIEQHGSHFFETTTATVKRQYSDFVRLHASLAEVPSLAAVLADISLPEGGRVEMENYLKQICTLLAAEYPPQLRHFLRPSSNSSKKADAVAPRLDRFLAKTVSGVFNTLKTVVPGFEMDPEIEVMPMPTLMSLADVPWRFVEDLNSRNLGRELQQLVAERIDYCSVDTAYEAVESIEGSGDSELLDHWWKTFNAPYDEELDELDTGISLTQMVIDLTSEILVGAGCDSVIEQEAVVRAIKLFAGNIAESSLQNMIRTFVHHLDNLNIFTSPISENNRVLDDLEDELLWQLMSMVPPQVKIFLGDNETSKALKFVMKSLENKKINRDLYLQLLDVLASQLLASSKLSQQVIP